MNIFDEVGKNNLSDILDEGIKNINQEEEVKKILAEKISIDIEQYIDKESWGDERPTVQIVDGGAYIIYNNKKMKPITFYSCAFVNNGKITKDNYLIHAVDNENI